MIYCRRVFAPVKGALRLEACPARRLIAFILDWTAAVAAGCLLVLSAGVELLITSELNRRDPPNWSVYLAAFIISLWLPGWFIYTSIAWSSRGCTLGMKLARVRVVDDEGRPLTLTRAACRAALLAASTTPLILGPLVATLSASLGTTGPFYMSGGFVLLFAASTLNGILALSCRGLVPFHDRVVGTRIVCLPG